MSQFIRENMDYLRELSEDYNVPIDTVIVVADMLGENELYDGLVATLEDYGDMYF